MQLQEGGNLFFFLLKAEREILLKAMGHNGINKLFYQIIEIL